MVDIVKGDSREGQERGELADLHEDYERFKTRNISRLKYSGHMQGTESCLSSSYLCDSLAVLAFKSNLEFIRIYFDSSMFQKISKVKSEKCFFCYLL